MVSVPIRYVKPRLKIFCFRFWASQTSGSAALVKSVTLDGNLFCSRSVAEPKARVLSPI